MVTRLCVLIHWLDTYWDDGTFKGFYRSEQSAQIPAPYQAGDTPEEHFAEQHGVRDRLIQYGNQPR